MHPIEKLSYRTAKVYVLDRSNRKQEAQAETEDIIKEIFDNNLNDQPLFEMLDNIVQETGQYEKLLQFREKLAQKYPQDQQIASRLFTLYTYQNEYQKMSSKATQLEKALNNPDYALYAIEALYLNSQVKNAHPSLINLSIGFLEKQRQIREAKNEPLPQYFVQLYCKIMSKKGDYDKVIEFLNKHEQSFGMILDKRNLMFKAYYHKNDKISAINELLAIIRDNYGNIEQFQSVYDHHELMISMIADLCSTKGMKGQLPINFINTELDQEQIHAELFQPISEQGLVQSLKNIYTSFKNFESIELENKSMNYHNCRKASILSQLLLKNKLLISLFDNQEIIEYTNNGDKSYYTLVQTYAERYIELNSMIFDLYPYIPFLNLSSRKELFEYLDQKVQTIQDEIRKARAIINLFKVKKVLGLIDNKNNEDILKNIEIMHKEYVRIVSLDSKPEKGERKIADDIVIVINEVLEPLFQNQVDSFVLYRIGLLEYALEKSPYNFDIQLQLVKIYDQLGLSPSFNQAVNNLVLKGVQLESMGYLQLRNIFDWADINQYKSFAIKYNKYSKFNSRDLKQCKVKALNENNYDQIENFIEYEDFINNSYFATLMSFTQLLIDFIENIQTQDEYSKGFFQNMSSQILEHNKQITDFSQDGSSLKKQRTQDLRISQNQYEQIPNFECFRKPEQQWIEEFQKDDYLREVTRNDKILSYFKFDRKNNYKSNYQNSLGFLELPQNFAIFHSLLATIAQLHNEKADSQQIIDQFRVQFEVYKKTIQELDFQERYDITSRYSTLIDYFTQSLSRILAILEFYGHLIRIVKKEGDESLKQLLTLKDNVGSLTLQLGFQQNNDMRQNFMDIWFASTVLPLSMDLVGKQLKTLIPSSKKKKKGGNPVLDEVHSLIINPIKQIMKDNSGYFSQQIKTNDLEEVVKESYLKLKDLSQNFLSENSSVNNVINEIIQKKMQEIGKEEKVTMDRFKDLGQQISKRLKEIFSSGLP